MRLSRLLRSLLCTGRPYLYAFVDSNPFPLKFNASHPHAFTPALGLDCIDDDGVSRRGGIR